jgi:hypothetical protein
MLHTEMIEWWTLKVMRTLQFGNQNVGSAVEKPHANLYSIPSLIMMGFFFVSASLAVSLKSKMIDLWRGKVGESSSSVRTVS